MSDPEQPGSPPTLGGAGTLVVVVYAVLALAATGRSVVQLAVDAGRAPVAYGLSAVAAAVYLFATWCLARGGRWVRPGTVACGIELAGVVLVGAASVVVPSAFPDRTVWSHFGAGYGFVPLVLPVLGLWWFRRLSHGRSVARQRAAASRTPAG
ncbi:MAG: hypothetical protein ACRCXL_00635 [Dermatophilaceae bacterium]